MKWMIINPNFKENRKIYLFKCFVALFATALVLTSFQFAVKDVILGVVGASSLASSIFIAFALPEAAAAHPKRMVGSYVCAAIIGIVFYYLATYLIVLQDVLSFSATYEAIGALAVTLTMLLMIMLSLEHPPATGLALGLVIEPWRWSTLLVIMLAIVCIAIIKFLVQPWLLSNSPHEP